MVNTGRPKMPAKERRVKKLAGYVTVAEEQEIKGYAKANDVVAADIVREATLDWVRGRKKK